MAELEQVCIYIPIHKAQISNFMALTERIPRRQASSSSLWTAAGLSGEWLGLKSGPRPSFRQQGRLKRVPPFCFNGVCLSGACCCKQIRRARKKFRHLIWKNVVGNGPETCATSNPSTLQEKDFFACYHLSKLCCHQQAAEKLISK
jgi:hypothetical protein